MLKFKLKNIKIKKDSYTLIEALVAIFLFSIISFVIAGTFVSGLASQQRILASQELYNQTSYAIEYTSRALRMAKKDTEGNCIMSGHNYEKPENWKIRFLNHNGKCQEFLEEDNQLKVRISTDGTANNLGPSLELTSSNLQVNSLNFNLSGQSGSDDSQPRATIFLEIKQKNKDNPLLKIQTTVSQRDIDTI